MSELGAGTDVMGMSTRAVDDGDDYILNGTKMWISKTLFNDQTKLVVLTFTKLCKRQGCWLCERIGM